MAVTIRVYEAMREIPREAWDALHTDRDSPFIEWTWLEALEATQCVSAERGWVPQHLTLWRDGQLVGAAPAYVKLHSEGEFVFDWAWADVAGRIGIEYYPKLIVAAPFTPATGSRWLRAPGEDLDAVVETLSIAARERAKQLGLSSVHVLFAHEHEIAASVRHGFAERAGIQFHWKNPGYSTFDDFLARFNSKHRNGLKRERAQPAKDAVTITTHRGDGITQDLVEPMFAFYASTVDKFFYGRRYLNREFFERVVERFRHRLEWVIARDTDGVPMAGAFNATRGKVLYGRYWGAKEDRRFLHFNVCFYHAIDACIRDGLELFEPGAGGEHKLARGFEPTITRSAHWIADARLDRVLREFLSREVPAVERAVHAEREQSPLRAKEAP